MKKFDWKNILKRVSLSLIVGLVLLVFSSSPAQAITFTRKPFLQNITPSTVEFRWVTDTNASLTIKYGKTTSYGSTVTSDTVSGTGGNNNHAKISGLTSNTKYYYQILAGSTALTSAGDANHYFLTAPATGSTAPFSFAFWGDSGNGSSAQNNVAKQVFNKKPNLAIIAGDIAYPYSSDFNNNNSKYFNQYNDTKTGQNSMSFAAYYVTCGNHETSCPTVMADHTLPGGGSVSAQSTYSFDYGNVHFVALNSNGSYSYNATSPQNSDPQIKWAYNDLKASSQPWKVVYWHHNGWSAGSHSTNSAIVSNMIHMASDAGADLVFWGHSHVYERWNKKSGYYPDVQAITIGNGGQSGSSSCTSSSPGPGCAAKSSGEAGFVWAQVSGDTMTLHYIKSDGSEGDTFSLNSGGTVTTVPSPTSANTPTPNATNTPTPKPTSTPSPTPTPAPAVASLYFSPSTQTRIGTGGTYSVNSIINPHGALVSAVEFYITFDPSIIRVDDISPGSFFTSPGIGQPVEFSKTIDNDLGTIHDVIAFPLGSNYGSSSVDVAAVITFTTVGFGTSNFTYVVNGTPSTKVSDINGSSILGQANGGSVTVIESISATPTPSPVPTHASTTPNPTNSPTPKPTSTPTTFSTSTPKPTATPLLTATITPKPTSTPTLTPTTAFTPTPLPTATPIPTATPYPGTSVTANPSVSPTSNPTPTTTTITPTPGEPITYEGCVESEGDWQKIDFASQSGTFMAEFDATPESENKSHVNYSFIGFSSSQKEDFTALGAIVSFDPTGVILARNGHHYTATNTVRYEIGSTYHFRFIIDMAGLTYSVYVTPPGGSEVELASNFAFRIEQRHATNFNTLRVYSRSRSRSIDICDLTITPLSGYSLSPAITGKLPRGRIIRPTKTPETTPTPLPTGSPETTPTPVPEPSVPPCRKTDGDDERDDKVDFDDFDTWHSHYNHSTKRGPKDGDFDCSGFTDGVDYVIWLNGYRRSHH